MADRILNEQQLAAVEHGDGPLLIIAGAGTGKTTVITERVKHLILKKDVHPSNILALTFTEKASREMEERIDITMPYGYTQMWVATFHAFCDRILRNEAIHIGLNPNYKLMSESETILFLRQHLFSFNLNYFRPLGNPNKFLEGMTQHFSRLRDEDISPQEYMQYAQQLGEETDEQERKKVHELAQAFLLYEELKAKEGVMDYADLIANTLKLFRSRSNVLKEYQKQFHYILIDEFQDTNFAQNQLAILLAGERQNITVVGDDDQAIYRWRGAAISNIIQFRTRFPKASIVTLNHNYRSTQEILDRSYTLIQNNNPDRLEVKEHIDKKLSSMRKIKGDSIKLLFAQRVEDEAEMITKKINELVTKENIRFGDIAILVRANDHAQAYVKSLERHAIPYQFLGPGKLLRQEEIKDFIAYLKVLYNFEDSTSLYRVLTLPAFAIPAKDIAALLNFSRRKNMSLFEALECCLEEAQKEIFLKEGTKEKVEKIVAMIKQHLTRVPTESAGQILYSFMEETGLIQNFLSPQSESETKKYQNIAKFFDKLKSFEAEHEDSGVFPVVEWIDLSMQMGESPIASDTDWSEANAVNILTIHSSKGLEFPVVFLVSLVSQRFPTRERREQIPIPQELIKEILPGGDYHMQEERRLFYVGMTRARDYLFLTAANFYGEGKRDRKISPFVYETLGEQEVSEIIQKRKIENSAVQQSLLDWMENYQETVASNVGLMTLTKQHDSHQHKITYVSYSQLQSFDICPLHYKLQYILKVPPRPAAALSYGSSIHGALRDFYQQWMQDNALQPEAVLALLKKVWINEGYASKEHQQKAFEQAKEILVAYLQKYNPQTLAQKPLGVELPFQFFAKHPQDPAHVVKIGGRIDRVDALDGEKIDIIDYKTGSNVPTERELLNNLQLTVYALAANQIKDILFQRLPANIVLSLHYLEEDRILHTTRSPEQLQEATLKIFQKIQEIEQSDFTCSHTLLCQNCEYKMLCSGLA